MLVLFLLDCCVSQRKLLGRFDSCHPKCTNEEHPRQNRLPEYFVFSTRVRAFIRFGWISAFDYEWSYFAGPLKAALLSFTRYLFCVDCKRRKAYENGDVCLCWRSVTSWWLDANWYKTCLLFVKPELDYSRTKHEIDDRCDELNFGYWWSRTC